MSLSTLWVFPLIVLISFPMFVFNEAVFQKCSTTELLKGSAKRWSPGLVYFVTAVAYHFCLPLPAAFTQPGVHFLAEPCTMVLL